MKSKNAMRLLDNLATNYIGNGATYEQCIEFCDVVKRIVRCAEQDARERAVKAFCDIQRLDCEAYCTPCTGTECYARNEYLKFHDNPELLKTE